MGKGSVYFEDNTLKVIDNTENAIEAALLEVSAEIVSQTARNTKVDTGQLKNSWAAKVAPNSEGFEAVIGSPLEYAIWQEFGTGEHALNGNGRKGGWGYTDPKTGEEVWTRGNKPTRAFHKAITSVKPTIRKRFEEEFGITLK